MLIWLSLNAGLSNASIGLLGNDQQPLPVQEAFVFDYEQTNGSLHLIWQIADNYYMYRDKMQVIINGQVVDLLLPPGQLKDDPLFGATYVYTQQVSFSVALTSAIATPISVVVGYQGCWEGGVCYPPQTSAFTLVNVANSVTNTTSSKTDVSSQGMQVSSFTQVFGTTEQLTNVNWFSHALSQSGVVLLLVFFAAGLALSLTPCMLPMVPILSNLIVGMQPRPGPLKSFLLSLCYVVAMASTYSLAGVISGLSGANMQMALQQPWVIGAMGLLFVLFAVAMFGWIRLQVPAVIQNRLNALYQQQSQGQFVGVMMMGIISALIVGPCVAAPLVGALLYIGQTGYPYTGALALFSLGMGMGMPLLIIGTSAGKLLPKTGVWMPRVNYAFGFLMLYMAVWQLDRIATVMTVPLVAIITLVAAALLWQMHRWQPPVKNLLGSSLGYILAVLFTLYGISLGYSFLAGQPSLIRPLAPVFTTGAVQQTAKLVLEKIQSAQVSELLLAAKQQQKPVLLDFYADWCITCKELDVFVFPAADVQQALAGWVFLKVDITHNTPLDRALLAEYQLVGPPALVFFDASGQWLSSQTIVGVPSAKQLSTTLTALHSQP